MTITQKIYDETLAHDGVTVDLLGNVPSAGFMVSELGGVEVPLDKFSVRDIKRVITKNKQALLGTGAYVGTWIDRETNIVYVDYSVNFSNMEVALAFGRKNGQKAIYSLDTKEVIYL